MNKNTEHPKVCEDFDFVLAETARLLRHLADRADEAAGLGYLPVEIHCHLSSALTYVLFTEDMLWSAQVARFSHTRMASYLSPQAFRATFVATSVPARSKKLKSSDPSETVDLVLGYMPPRWTGDA